METSGTGYTIDFSYSRGRSLFLRTLLSGLLCIAPTSLPFDFSQHLYSTRDYQCLLRHRLQHMEMWHSRCNLFAVAEQNTLSRVTN
jgi:hypothetical protein